MILGPGYQTGVEAKAQWWLSPHKDYLKDLTSYTVSEAEGLN